MNETETIKRYQPGRHGFDRKGGQCSCEWNSWVHGDHCPEHGCEAAESPAPAAVAFTPGPWQVIVAGSYQVTAPHFVGSIADVREELDVAVRSDQWDARRASAKANAQLIAAAPDLYAAAVGVREACPCDPDINPRWNAAWDMLCAAIEKAKGT
jgi:hypothetical protein